VIEGTWSGYIGSQQRIVHRWVHDSKRDAALRRWADVAHAVHFTDGTALFIGVRDCKPRERVQRIDGYRTMIAECCRYGVVSVDALLAAKAATGGAP
jgi:hypothetical protein